MKRIIIVCAALVVAAVTQAASVNWTISNVYIPGSDTDKLEKGTATAYLFIAENTTDVALKTTTLSAVQDILKTGNLEGLKDLSVASGVNTAAGMWTGATGLTGFSSGTVSAFAVVVDGSAEKYLLVSNGDAKSATFTSPAGAKALAWGDQTSFSKGEGKWTSLKGGGDVPEPTSGMLLLLGLAGLALRRKQK